MAKENKIGSWDHQRPRWENLSFTLTGQLWGIKANQIVKTESYREFTYPLSVTEVQHGGEAHRVGIMVGDIIVQINSVKVRARVDLIELPNDHEKTVCSEVHQLLVSGGTCGLHVKRNNSKTRCTECSGKNLVEVREEGQLVCQDCGVIAVSRLVTVGSNWENESTTHIDQDVELHGSDDVVLLCEKLDLDLSIVTHAKKELRLFYKEKDRKGGIKLRSHPHEALAAACILVACRFRNVGRTEKEVLAVCTCTKRQLAVVQRGLHRVICEISNRRIPTSTPKDVLQRFCTNLRLNSVIVSVAKHIATELDKRGICQSRLVASVSGAVIFVASLLCRDTGDPKTDRELLRAISAATGAADATIKEVCKTLHDYKDVLLPSEYACVDLSTLLH